jgi:hypothetical protein
MSNLIVLCGGLALTVLSVLLYVSAVRQKTEWTHGRPVQLFISLLFVSGLLLSIWVMQSSGAIGKQRLDTITFSLAIVAIVFAAVQFADSQAQEYKMNVLVKEMSTRFIGNFPKNIADIIQIAEQANNHFEVMTDYVSYGYYSDPDNFEKLLRCLEDLVKKNVEVNMLIYPEHMAEEALGKQFPSKWFEKALVEKSQPLLRFCKLFDKGLYESITKWKEHDDATALKVEFDRLMLERQRFYLKDLIERGVAVKKTSDKLPFYFWCEDGHEAIFAFFHEKITDGADQEDTLEEVAFRSRDSSLVILSFEPIFKQLWKKATLIKLNKSESGMQPDWS